MSAGHKEPFALLMAERQKEISVSDFFAKNRQILGFDNPSKALIVSVKEGVDNSLDACEEAGILPEIRVEIEEVSKEDGFYRVVVEDNGPGIVRSKVPNVFGKLLYGSRFYSLKQSRGQQGIGISAVVLYGQLTAGKPAVVETRIGEDHPAYRFELSIDTKRNEPVVLKEDVVLWERPHGTRVEVILKGRYYRDRKQSVLEYLRSTAIVNPHVEIEFRDPSGEAFRFHRATERLPVPPKEIKPHPYGVELGTFLTMLRHTEARRVTSFLSSEFSRVSPTTAKEIVKRAGIDEKKKPYQLTHQEAQKLLRVMTGMKFMAPPTDCLSPIGSDLIKKGLNKEIDSKFVATVTRDPKVFLGTPFQVEVGLVYGGELPSDQQVQILRFANRVPLLYQQGSCALTKAVERINWRLYGLEQRGGTGIPYGPAAILIHLCSVNIPYTSESKEAVAEVDEIVSEIIAALREVGRKLKTYIHKRERLKKMEEKYSVIAKVLPEIARKSAEILQKDVPPMEPVFAKVMNVITVRSEVEAINGSRRGEDGYITRILVSNYTPRQGSMELIVKLPKCEVKSLIPEPAKRKGEVLYWKVGPLSPGETSSLSFEVHGLESFDENDVEIYYRGGRGEVIGAERFYE